MSVCAWSRDRAGSDRGQKLALCSLQKKKKKSLVALDTHCSAILSRFQTRVEFSEVHFRCKWAITQKTSFLIDRKSYFRFIQIFASLLMVASFKDLEVVH